MCSCCHSSYEQNNNGKFVLENSFWNASWHPPTYDELRTIGCLFYAHKVGEKDKFEPRPTKCILLGYTLGFKGYKLYDLQTHELFHSRDVLFQEHIFPFKQQSLIHEPSGSVKGSPSLFPDIDPLFFTADSSPSPTSYDSSSAPSNSQLDSTFPVVLILTLIFNLILLLLVFLTLTLQFLFSVFHLLLHALLLLPLKFLLLYSLFLLNLFLEGHQEFLQLGLKILSVHPTVCYSYTRDIFIYFFS